MRQIEGEIDQHQIRENNDFLRMKSISGGDKFGNNVGNSIDRMIS